jgi:Sulfotransferase domain
MLPHQVEQFNRLVYPHVSAKAKKTLFIKIHDAYTFSANDQLPLIPSAGTKMAIYIVRNPLDVALSLVNHVGKPLDYIIDKFITNTQGSFLKRKITSNNQFYQPLGTWNMHVESWKQHPNFPVHFLRYEDIKAAPFETFSTAVKAIDLCFSDEQIQQAISETEFDKLQNKEKEKGFVEKQLLSSMFF